MCYWICFICVSLYCLLNMQECDKVVSLTLKYARTLANIIRYIVYKIYKNLIYHLLKHMKSTMLFKQADDNARIRWSLQKLKILECISLQNQTTEAFDRDSLLPPSAVMMANQGMYRQLSYHFVAMLIAAFSSS